MFKQSIYILAIVFIFYSCQKEHSEPFTTGISYPGALDSCALFLSPGNFNSDSGVYTGTQVQTFRFSYDDQRRVVKMVYADVGINFPDIFTTFFYNGQSKNAYLVKDSSFGFRSSLVKHKLFYDNLDRVILDSTIYYSFNTDGTIDNSSIINNVTNYKYFSNYMIYTSARYPFKDNLDTVYFNSNSDEIKNIYDTPISTRGYNYGPYEYYPVESPFYKLNIRTAYDAFPRFYGYSTPSGSINLACNKYLVKKIQGFRYISQQPWEHFTCKANFYYETDASNRVDRLVIMNYENITGRVPTYIKSLSSIRFFYHQ